MTTKEERRLKREEEKKAQQLKREEFERTHGQMLTKVAGVTFKNEDGSKRQAYLKEAFANESIGAVSFQEYEHEGKPAVHILFDGMCVGNIPAPNVEEFLGVKDRIESANIFVNRFSPDDEDESGRRKEIIYRADLYIVYKLPEDSDT